ncbi:Prefoldin subunit 2 [Orchesella cincta]|uniref:Prefoldin subunit 2 n=1 Tax=Orchesella cincta TaxID=48709 RepID=A0A1D2MPB3_ORCCI|nr:Prefoldin subunit 2 [Orchesella cincta]
MSAVDTAKKAAGGSSGKSKKSPEETIAGFNVLRTEQRQIASKIFELENDLNEHKVVIETLKEVDGERKCYRMIGGILVEGNVKEILPNLITNSDHLKQAIESLNTKLVEKGKEILEYKEKNNIQFQVPEKILEEDESAADSSETSKNPAIDAASKGVLLSDKT